MHASSGKYVLVVVVHVVSEDHYLDLVYYQCTVVFKITLIKVNSPWGVGQWNLEMWTL